jgi:MFS family permease
MTRDAEAGREGLRRLSTIILCSLAFNLTLGVGFGSFGPLLPANEAYFGINRAYAATGMGALVLALGGLSPLLAGLLRHVAVRAAMMVGCLLCGIAYLGLAFTPPNYEVALAMYALMGAGISLTAILGPVTLVARWITDNRGKVLSIVCLPLALVATPFVIAELLPNVGRFGILLGLGAILLAFTPLLGLISEFPSGAEANKAVPSQVSSGGTSILRSVPFWLLSIAIGIMGGVAVAFLVHAVPFALGRSLSLPAASSLISSHAMAGIGGTLLFGWLADRCGPPAALALATGLGSLLWGLFFLAPDTALFVIAGGIGACTTPLNTLHGAALSALFGADRVGQALGYSFAVKAFFLLSFGPLVGWMFEQTGSYRIPFMLCTASLLLSSALFLVTAMLVRQRAAARALPA